MIAEALRKPSRNLRFATSRFKRNKRHSSIVKQNAKSQLLRHFFAILVPLVLVILIVSPPPDLVPRNMKSPHDLWELSQPTIPDLVASEIVALRCTYHDFRGPPVITRLYLTKGYTFTLHLFVLFPPFCREKERSHL